MEVTEIHKQLKVAMVQINSTVGDLTGNVQKMKKFLDNALKYGADIVIFPELAVTGYPPQDLLFEKSFIEENRRLVNEIILKNSNEIIIVGFVDQDLNGNLFNAAAVFQGHNLAGVVYKTLLPTYDVFDEDRYFTPNKEEDIKPVEVLINGRKLKLGVEICEDLWTKNTRLKSLTFLLNVEHS